MCVTSSLVKTFPINSSSNKGEPIQAELVSSKLIVFEGSASFRITDLEVSSKQSCDFTFSLDEDVVDRRLRDHYLWLVLKSGEVIIIDVINCTQLKITFDNYVKYQITRLGVVEDELILISESGECLKAPYSTLALNEEFSKGTSEVTTKLEKARVRCSDFSKNSKCIMNGLKLFTESGKIVAQCPVTNLCHIIESDVNVDQIVPWGDSTVLANHTNMWVMDLRDSKTLFNFNNEDGNYYALAANNSNFYYLLWNKSEVKVFCAWNTSAVEEDIQDPDFSNKSINKSSQDTLKSQMQVLVESVLANSASSSQVLTQIKTLYDKVEDIDFLIETSFKLCQHNIAYKVLLHLLKKKIHTDDNNFIKRISDLMIKVDLSEYILFRGIKTYENINLFLQNFKQLCIMFISNSDLDLASICWLKYSKVKMEFLADDVVEILEAMPHNIKMSGLIIWLRNFVPHLLDENPYFIDIFVKWTTKRVFLFEHSSYWPKIGLKFIDEIIGVLEKSTKTISVRPISMDDLDILKDHITYIMELKERYKINMLLGEISSQNPNEVALIMLRRCYTEDLYAFLQDYLPAYATRYIFNLDDTLRSYVENEAATGGGGIDSSRLKIIVDSFRSPTIKLECLLQVLKVLDVPWDNTVESLAITAAASVFKDFTVRDMDRVLAQEIQQELNYAKVKVVLKKHNFPLTCTDYNLVLNKLINAATVDLNDLKVITSGIINSSYGSILYIDRCLRDNDTRSALDYFHDQPRREKQILLKTVLAKFEQIISSEVDNSSVERNYLDFLKGTKLLQDIQRRDIENLYHLKNSYGTPLNMNSLYIEAFCINKAENFVNDDQVTASSGRGRCVTQITRTAKQSHHSLIMLLRRTSTKNQVRKVIESLISKSSYDDSSVTQEISTVLSIFKYENNSSLLIETFNVIIELLTSCREEQIRYIVKYMSVLNALMNTNIVKNLSVAWKFHYIFLPMLSVNAANELIDFYNKYLSHRIFETFDENIIKNDDFMTFRILSNLLTQTNNNLTQDLIYSMDEMKSNAAKRLLTKVAALQDLDELLLTSLLLILCASEANDDTTWIIDALQGQNDSMPPLLMGYLTSSTIRHTFCLDNVLPGDSTAYPPQYVLKCKFNINLADVALPDSNEETWDVRVVLLHVLRQYPETNFQRLVDLCHTLNVPINDGLSLQLISLLSMWELKYKVFNDELGCRQIHFANDESDILSKCFTIWESIDDKTFLNDILNDFWKNGEVTLHGRVVSINPYYYEVYVCIFHLIYGSSADSKQKKEYFLLNFLKEYRRKSTPKQYEFELFSVKGMFPEIGHYRLPFHLFMREDMWSNLKSEITLETYERWLPAVVLLALDADLQTAKDMICSNALKQTMTTRKHADTYDDENKDTEPWRLTTKEEPLLRAAHRCVRHIANMEWAGACLFYVLQGCARGADQVAAAHLCYQFAQRWAALQPGNRAVRQMERLHSTLSTRHALHKIEWAKEEFLKLAAEPAQLIRAMYLHPNFVEKMSRHDVNRAVNEIADNNGINISSIRIQILENILTRSKEENERGGSCGLDHKKLMTAKYILKATCPKMGAIYLSRIAFDDESDYNKCKKLRALQCLMSVVDSDTAVKVTNQERDALWSSLLELFYVVNLEDIDMPWLIATFTEDKVKGLQQLLQAATGNVDGLRLAAELAHKYGNTNSMKSLISLLLRSGLYEELIPLLLKMTSPPDEIIYTAWRAVILSPFQRADYPITERQKAKCINAINLLPVCPIIKDDDLIEIWKHCVRCKCFGLGCLVLPYISPPKRQTLTELQKIDRRNLIASLKNLHSETYLVSGAMTVLESMSSRGYR